MFGLRARLQALKVLTRCIRALCLLLTRVSLASVLAASPDIFPSLISKDNHVLKQEILNPTSSPMSLKGHGDPAMDLRRRCSPRRRDRTLAGSGVTSSSQPI